MDERVEAVKQPTSRQHNELTSQSTQDATKQFNVH
jgi:hypothetical protein